MLPVRLPSCETLCGKRSLMPRSPDQTGRTNRLIDRTPELARPLGVRGQYGAQRGQTLFITSRHKKETEVYGKCKARGGQTFRLLTHDRFENLTRGPNKSKSFVDPHNKRNKIM